MTTINVNLPLSYETGLTGVSARSTVINEDLTFHIESLSDNELTNGVIVFSPLTEIERDEVLQFYNDNKNQHFDFVNPHDGVTYHLYFIDPVPKSQAISGWSPLRYQVTYTVAG